MTGIARKIVVHGVILTLLAGISVGQNGALLHPGDGTSLNGSKVRSNSAVSSGDKLQTGKGGAHITAASLMVRVDPNTTVQFGDILQLGCGAVSVNGKKAVAANNISIAPNSPAQYEVTNRGGNLRVQVQSGSVRVASGETITLTDGQSKTLPGTAGCAVVPGAVDGSTAAPKSNGKLIGIGSAGAAAVIIRGLVPSGGSGEASTPRR